ncbi:MAG TPA: LamG-like jellyroll fold domain-containing protein [bacterium]|nr:LamG-like jellyroll fold domain-containing protein [bacterium]
MSTLAATGCSFHAGVSPTDAGTPAGPTITQPAAGQELIAARTYLSWQAGEVPLGRTITNYEFCSTSDDAIPIDNASECPRSAVVPGLFTFLDTPVAGATYRFKVRAHLDDGSSSAYSVLGYFSTSSALIARWKMDDVGSDTTGSGHDAVPRNGAGFVPGGLIGPALSLAGGDDHATVDDAPVLNFGVRDFAWAAWVNPDISGVFQTFLEKGTSTNGFEIYRRPSGGLAFAGHACGEIVLVNGIVDGEWHRTFISRANGTVSVYIDGVLAGSGICADDFNNTAHLALGCNSPERGCSTPLQGRMDEILALGTAVMPEMVLNDFCADETAAGVDPLPAACHP